MKKTFAIFIINIFIFSTVSAEVVTKKIDIKKATKSDIIGVWRNVNTGSNMMETIEFIDDGTYIHYDKFRLRVDILKFIVPRNNLLVFNGKTHLNTYDNAPQLFYFQGDSLNIRDHQYGGGRKYVRINKSELDYYNLMKSSLKEKLPITKPPLSAIKVKSISYQSYTNEIIETKLVRAGRESLHMKIAHEGENIWLKKDIYMDNRDEILKIRKGEIIIWSPMMASNTKNHPSYRKVIGEVIEANVKLAKDVNSPPSKPLARIHSKTTTSLKKMISFAEKQLSN